MPDGRLPGTRTLTIPAWIQELPKAELHLHLEGSITPETVVALGREHGRSRVSLSQARKRMAYRDFPGFLEAFHYGSQQLQTPEDYALLLRALLRDLHRQNVLYAEITLAAGVVLWKHQDVNAVFVALREAAEEARKEQALEIRWIFDAVRQFGAEHVAQVAEHALRWKDAGVVAFGIGGDEQAGPPELFRATFDKVRSAGLRVTVHAGETGGPESIWGALRALGADRIGHGLAAYRDPELLEHLREKQIPLEICPTSNRRTGALAQHTGGDDMRRHPVVDYCQRGLRVTLNTDDPGLFETTLNAEYALAHELGLEPSALRRAAETAFEAAFCEGALKRALLERFRTAVAGPGSATPPSQ